MTPRIHTRIRVSLATLSLVICGWPTITFAAPPETGLVDYLNQKYRLYLGDSGRSACGYFIDPEDIYQQGNHRFTTARLSRGTTGTACAGVLQLQLLKVDCSNKTTTQLELEGYGREAQWRSSELRFSQIKNNNFADVTQEVAETVCKLPGTSKVEPAEERHSHH